MRRHHSTEPGEVRERDKQRMNDVYATLAAAGIPLSHDDASAYVRVEMPEQYHAVDVRQWSDDEQAADQLADRIDAVLWAAGYLVHRSRSSQVIRVYKPDWGGGLPQVNLTVTEFAEPILGIKPSTWRSYVSRGQAPGPDGHHAANLPYWNASTIDTFRRDRPGQGARTDRAAKTAKDNIVTLNRASEDDRRNWAEAAALEQSTPPSRPA